MGEAKQLTYHGSGDIYIAASSSRLGLFHYTVVNKEGNANCTCEGWRTHKKCWHVKQALERSGIEEEPTEFQVSL